jgi:hypothetical protein
MSIFALDKLIAQARQLAADYRRATGKSLPISNEIAKHDACVALQLQAMEKESGGYDAIGQSDDWQGLRMQIKGRAIFDESKRNQRIGQLKLDKEWDAVILVIMNEAFDSIEMYFVPRDVIADAIQNDKSSRSERGAMSVAKFKNIAQLVWTKEQGRITNEMWDNQVPS